jgi:hypothetical protein
VWQQLRHNVALLLDLNNRAAHAAFELNVALFRDAFFRQVVSLAAALTSESHGW